MGRKAGQGEGAATKERILRIAAQLFAAQGFHATGLADLEKATGLGRGALYYHITSKEELLFEITSRYLRILITEGTPLLEQPLGAEAKLRAFSHLVMRTLVEHLAEMTVCFREVYSVIGERKTQLLDLHRDYERIWAQILEQGVEQGVFNDAGFLAVKSILGLHHYSYLWIRPDKGLSAEQTADYFCDLFMGGVQQRGATSCKPQA